MWWRGWSGVVAVLVSGCAGTATVETRFDPRDADFAARPGKGRIEGEAFVRRDYGRLVTAAGERIFLIPATPYAVERFAKMFDGAYRSYYGNEVEAPPEEYYRHRRETKVDMTGRFTFENVPAGRWIVATRVFWTEPKSFLTHGGAVYDFVDVRNDQTSNVVVSGK